DGRVMCSLGGHYYGLKKYDLAEKYYLMAFDHHAFYAATGLGFIYYYGRVRQPDYEKAFFYFSKAKEEGDLEAAMKLADMVHNGYGTEKDDVKYKAMLLEIFDKVKDTQDLFDPYPEVAHRLASIYIEEGHGEDATTMLRRGKLIITQRIRYSPFWGNFIVARRLITLFYQLIPLDPNTLDFFDLFSYLASPKAVMLYYGSRTYRIESLIDEGALRVHCGDSYYKSIEDFLTNALFEGKHTYVIDYDDYYVLQPVE
ncbi:MAG: sel1 repeat family protein, partial [Bacilli bacterium]|nr:sel1 repeat family protein [Bacilli bacterium]